RWLTYATAGAASAFACAHSADGTIHYSGPINQPFFGCHRSSATFPLDRPGDTIRLRDSIEFCSDDYGGGAYFAVSGIAGAAFAGRRNPCQVFASLILASRLLDG